MTENLSKKASNKIAVTTTIVILHSYHHTLFRQRLILSAICVALSFIVFIALFFSRYFSKILGVNGIKISTRLTGLITSALGAQMIATGLILLFPMLGRN